MIKNAPRITLAAACAAGLFATIAVAGPSTTPGAPVLSTSGGISSPRNLISPEAEIVVTPSEDENSQVSVVELSSPAQGTVDIIAKPSENENSQVSEGVLDLTPANSIGSYAAGGLAAVQERVDPIGGFGGAQDLSGGINIINGYLAQY